MKGKKILNCKKTLERTEDESQYVICTDCEIPSCNGCGTYKEVIDRPTLTYSELLMKTISENNIALLKNTLYAIVGFLASLLSFSRLAEFKEEQLYLETVLLTVLCYLTSFDVTIGFGALFGGLLHWYLAFRIENKWWTVLVMTFLQVNSNGVRQFQWLTAIQSVFFLINVKYKIVLNAKNAYGLLSSISMAYIVHVIKVGVCLEDLFLCIIMIFANNYKSTGDIQQCYLQENISLLIIWLLLKRIRESTDYSGLKFKLF